MRIRLLPLLPNRVRRNYAWPAAPMCRLVAEAAAAARIPDTKKRTVRQGPGGPLVYLRGGLLAGYSPTATRGRSL